MDQLDRITHTVLISNLQLQSRNFDCNSPKPFQIKFESTRQVLAIQLQNLDKDITKSPPLLNQPLSITHTCSLQVNHLFFNKQQDPKTAHSFPSPLLCAREFLLFGWWLWLRNRTTHLPGGWFLCRKVQPTHTHTYSSRCSPVYPSTKRYKSGFLHGRLAGWLAGGTERRV